MPRRVQLVVPLLLIATVASAQHATGFRGGSMTGSRSGAGQFRSPSVVSMPAGRDGWFVGRGFNRRFGNFAGPYSPYLWAYPFSEDYGLNYLPGAEDRATNNETIVQSGAPPLSAAPPPAHAVIKEYKWNEFAGTGATTFTIALKDGSKRYSLAVWVQDGNLHYLDSQGRQQVISSEVIDRNATERLNSQSDLKLQLPPG